DPFNDFLPATGVVRYLRPPAGPGVRWDGGVEAGNEVTLFYDPLIAKLIAWGETREVALQRMRRALRELVIVGLPTSQAFHLRVMDEPRFRRGEVDSTYLERVGSELLAQQAPAELARPLAPVTAPCGHYQQDHCGGCQLQHLSYDAQLAAKRAIVGDALRRIGKLDVADPEIVEAVEEWRYRAKISLAVKQVGRTDPKGLPDGRGRTAGLHPYDRPGSLFPLMDCHITDFRLMALWRDLKQHLDLLPPRCTRLTLRLDREGRRHVLAESSGEPWRDEIGRA